MVVTWGGEGSTWGSRQDSSVVVIEGAAPPSVAAETRWLGHISQLAIGRHQQLLIVQWGSLLSAWDGDAEIPCPHFKFP